jgi:hypothetical protein
MLYVESDGRHMAAITREGKIAWHRNLFDGLKPESVFVPPPRIEGELGFSDEEWRRYSDVSRLSIDRIGIEPDCVLRFIDHDLPPHLHGHYIRAGSGTHIFWLIDAKTGDLQVQEIN